jgi:hypothetical protein
MANVNKTSYAVSVTPKMQMDNVDGVNQAIDVINEHVRTSLGGAGEITGNDTTVAGGWADGVNTPITSNNGTVPTHDANTDLIFFKHTGFLIDGTTVATSAQTALIKHDGDVIGTLGPGEAMVLPRPTGAVLTMGTGSGSNHVGVEILVVGT